jgi:hypothetical protein
MTELRRLIIAIGKPVLKTRDCDYCRGIKLDDGERFCSDRCKRHFTDNHILIENLQRTIDTARDTIEKLKADGLRPLRDRITRLEKENACLLDENIELRKGCERVKVLDNPAMRWIHRALRNADMIRKNFKKS